MQGFTESLDTVFPARGRFCTWPANATRTLTLCYTKVESCVAFVECVCAWCEFGVVLSGVFEVCVSSAIASPIIPPLVDWLQVPDTAGGPFVGDCPVRVHSVLVSIRSQSDLIRDAGSHLLLALFCSNLLHASLLHASPFLPIAAAFTAR